MFKANIVLDSFNVENCSRITTMEVTYPRFVHSEFMTHRVFSRNAASSRAIPVEKMLQVVKDDPAMPVFWGHNQSGMQASKEVDDKDGAIVAWLVARDSAIKSAQELLKFGLHKQIVNRVLEPFAWITVIVTGTDWDNFFNLRCHKDAQPEIRYVAQMMLAKYQESVPIEVIQGYWHRPYAEDLKSNDSLSEKQKNEIAVARCARVSYLTHDGRRDPDADLLLYGRLLTGGHMSPFEHVAVASNVDKYYGNLRGWVPERKFIPNEKNVLAGNVI